MVGREHEGGTAESTTLAEARSNTRPCALLYTSTMYPYLAQARLHRLQSVNKAFTQCFVPRTLPISARECTLLVYLLHLYSSHIVAM
jgi:hypothetical protein